MLIAAGVCGILASLCQLATALALSFLCAVADIFVETVPSHDSLGDDDSLQGYNDAIKALGADENNYFIQTLAGDTQEVHRESQDGFACGLFYTFRICGYVSAGLLLVASILAFMIPDVDGITTSDPREVATQEQPAEATVAK